MTVTIERANINDLETVAIMVGELLSEIMNAIATPAFNFNLEQTIVRLNSFIEQEKYFVFIARSEQGELAGFITLYESYALYAEGVFGTIAEFYVRPDYRNHGVGFELLAQAKTFGKTRAWTRLEVTTPPLPPFERTLAFYQREGFAIAGGRKMKLLLE